MESWFRNPSNPRIANPAFAESMSAVRIISYAPLIQEIINADCPPADLTDDCRLDFKDLKFLAEKWLKDCNASNNWCSGADMNGDYCVDFGDFALITSQLLTAATGS